MSEIRSTILVVRQISVRIELRKQELQSNSFPQSEIRVAKKLSWLEPEVQFAKLSEREANPRLFQKKKFAKST